MRFIKLAFISLLFIAILLLVISALLPSQVRISRAINIENNPAAIASYLNDLRNWKEWNLFLADSVIGTANFYRDSLASAKLQIGNKQRSDSVITLTWYRGRHEIQNGFTLQQSCSSTVLQWYFDFQLRWYPWEKFASIIFDKQFGPPMERSLELVKKKLESTP